MSNVLKRFARIETKYYFILHAVHSILGTMALQLVNLPKCSDDSQAFLFNVTLSTFTVASLLVHFAA